MGLSKDKKRNTNRVVFQPTTYQSFQRGINTIVDAISPTLGPVPRTVGIERFPSKTTPELLDNGGVIARRITQLPERDVDVGAMFIRELLWKLYEKEGDGTATAAVIFQSIFNDSLRHVASGGNPMILRKHLQTGLGIILEQLDTQKVPLFRKEQFAQVVRSTCTDPDLGEVLAEVLDIVGPYGLVDVRGGRARAMDREFVEGSYWDSGALSPHMLTGQPDSKAELVTPAILITNMEIEEPQEILPALETASKAGFRKLMITASKLSEKVIGLLLAASKNPDKFLILGAKSPGESILAQRAYMEDMAVLTGSRLFNKEAGETLRSIQPGDFGHTHKAWVTKRHMGFVRGENDPASLRSHIAKLKQSFLRSDDPDSSQMALDRIGRLLGGSAILYVGGATKTEIESRKTMAERSLKTLRAALDEGIVPGGGLALLNCQAAILEKISSSESEDERFVYRILSNALEAPSRRMFINASLDPGIILARIRESDPGTGFDLRRNELTSMQSAGIHDVTRVLKSALRSAVSGAALALTVDVFIHRKNPPQGFLAP